MKTGRGFLIIIGEGNSFIILQFILRFFLFESSSRNITENPRICLFLFSEISLKNMGNREICGRKRSSDYSPLTLNINPPTMDFPGPVFSYFQKFRSKTKRRRKQRKRDPWKKAIERLFSEFIETLTLNYNDGLSRTYLFLFSEISKTGGEGTEKERSVEESDRVIILRIY